MPPRSRQRSAEEDVAVPPPSVFGRAMSPSHDLKRRRRSDDGSGASRSFPERAVTRVTPADTPATTFPNVPTVGPSGLIHKRQYVRLLEQSLYELGYADLASAL